MPSLAEEKGAVPSPLACFVAAIPLTHLADLLVDPNFLLARMQIFAFAPHDFVQIRVGG